MLIDRRVKPLRSLLFALLAVLPLTLGAQSIISDTILVPLHYRTIESGG